MKEKIVQVAHVTLIPGPVQTLADFIEKRSDFVLEKIYFNLDDKKTWLYFLDFLKIRHKVLREEKIDLAIGMNCFDTLPLICLKKRKDIGKVVFFGTDFSRKRFDSKLLNWIYIMIDRYCARKADFVCCNSKRTINKRLSEGVTFEKIIYTPNGVFLDEINNKVFRTLERKLVYVGHVSREHGLREILETVLKSNLSLDIIGDGPDLNYLKNKYRDRSQINFLGRKSHCEVLNYLDNFYGFGLAPYVLNSDWTYYCDPVKVKEYLAFGVPVIISAVSEVSEKIKKEHLGFVFNNKKELFELLKKVENFKNSDYQVMIERIIKKRKEYDLSQIYREMLDRIVAR